MAENPFAAELDRRAKTTRSPPSPRKAPAQANPFTAEIERRQQATNAPTFFEAAGRAGLRRFLDNFLNLGEFMVSGFGSERGPLSVLKNVELPSAADVMATANTVLSAQSTPGGIFGGQIPASQRFALNRAAEGLTSQRFAEQAPIGTAVGETGADVASLLTGRLPVKNLKGRLPAGAPKVPLPPGLRRQVDDIFRGPFVKQLGRGFAKAGETGLEGATLSILNEGDPVNTAAFAAGGQAAGSLSLYLVTKPVKRLIPFVVGTTILAQSFQALAPGERNAFESFDFAIDKLLFAGGTGALAALLGAGRIGGRTAENLPKIADAITAIPRSAALSFLQDLTKADKKGDDTMLRVIETVSQNPDAFTPAVLDRLNKAFMDGKLPVEIDKLMRGKKFREKLDELSR